MIQGFTLGTKGMCITKFFFLAKSVKTHVKYESIYFQKVVSGKVLTIPYPIMPVGVVAG